MKKEELSDTVTKLIEDYAHENIAENAAYLGTERNEAAKIIVSAVQSHQEQHVFQNDFQASYVANEHDLQSVLNNYINNDFAQLKKVFSSIIEIMGESSDWYANKEKSVEMIHTVLSTLQQENTRKKTTTQKSESSALVQTNTQLIVNDTLHKKDGMYELMGFVVDTLRETDDYLGNLNAITKLQNTLFRIDKERTELYH